MVEYSSRELDLAFHALSDPTRRSMLARLAKGECTVSQLAEPYALTFAGVSKHLKVLEEARFVQKKKQGRVYRCRANLEPLEPVMNLLEELASFWSGQLDSLEDYFENEKKQKQTMEKTKTWQSTPTPARRRK